MAATLHPAAIPTSHPDSAAQLSAILTGAAIAPLADRAFLRISGPDATRWLNGMVTNNIQALAPGEGNDNFILNAQGRILGDCTVYREPAPEPPAFLLETDTSQIDAIEQHLDKFIIMDDVELTRGKMGMGILVVGPRALELLVSTGFNPAADNNLTIDSREDTGDRLICAGTSIVPRYEIWSGSPQDHLAIASALRRQGATPVSPEALEALRILSGTPLYGVDIRNTDAAHDLPQETAQTRALHFAKGCYLGQEIVERIRSRGSVHRTFHGFELTGALPAPGTALTAESLPRPVGELTSVAAIPLPASASTPARTVQLALGYVRREVLDRALTLEYPGGTATPVALPWPVS